MNSTNTTLVTGGAGFIGSHMCDSLIETGNHVLVLDDLSTGSLKNIQHLIGHPNFEFHLGSVLDQDLCGRLAGRCHEIIHLAAAVGVKMIFDRPMETIERNVRGTEIVLESALKHGRRVFIASTSEVYGKEPRNMRGQFSEADDITLGPSMRWSYACSKAVDEYLARAYSTSKGLPVTIGRFFNTVGPRQSGAYGMVIPRFIEWALAGKPIQIYGDGRQIRTFTHVKDAVRAVRALIGNPWTDGEIFNIGSSEPISIWSLAERIRELTVSKSELVLLAYEQAYGRGFDDIRNRVPDLTKIEAAINYRPHWSLEQILCDTVEYARPGGRAREADGLEKQESSRAAYV
jgi:UDP-glucose 4-epimerase